MHLTKSKIPSLYVIVMDCDREFSLTIPGESRSAPSYAVTTTESKCSTLSWCCVWLCSPQETVRVCVRACGSYSCMCATVSTRIGSL